MNGISKEEWYNEIENRLTHQAVNTVRIFMSDTWRNVFELSSEEYAIARKKYLTVYAPIKITLTVEDVNNIVKYTYDSQRRFLHNYIFITLATIQPDLQYIIDAHKSDYSFNKVQERLLTIGCDAQAVKRFRELKDKYNNNRRHVFILKDKQLTMRYLYRLLHSYQYKLQDFKLFYIKYFLPLDANDRLYRKYGSNYLNELKESMKHYTI